MAELVIEAAVRYPEQYNARDEDRLVFLFAAKEKLREQHQAKGAQARAGTITLEEFQVWENEVWMPKSTAVEQTICALRQSVGEAHMDDVELSMLLRSERPA